MNTRASLNSKALTSSPLQPSMALLGNVNIPHNSPSLRHQAQYPLFPRCPYSLRVPLQVTNDLTIGSQEFLKVSQLARASWCELAPAHSHCCLPSTYTCSLTSLGPRGPEVFHFFSSFLLTGLPDISSRSEPLGEPLELPSHQHPW